MMIRNIWLAAALTAALAMSSNAADLIVNGSFESGSSGWVIGDPDGDSSTLVYNGDYLGATAHIGSWFVWGGEINPEIQVPGATFHAGIVQQFGIETTPGVEYTLTFWLRNLADGGPADNHLEVYWNNFGSGDGILEAFNIEATSDYQQYSVNLVGGADPGTLTFEMSNPPTALLLDDVGLTESVPEPGTWVLFGSGLLLAGLGKYRRARN